MTQLAVGSIVQIRNDITEAEKQSIRFFGSRMDDQQKFAGRIAIVCQIDLDDTVRLFIAEPDYSTFVWLYTIGVTVLTAAEIAKQDVHFIYNLRKSFEHNYPEPAAICEPDQISPRKRIKIALAEIRVQLTAIESVID